MPRKKKTQNVFSTIRKEFGNENYGIKQYRRDLAKLKKKGLISKKIDARSQDVTRYMKNQIRKFADVLSGKSQVVTVPTKEKKEYQSAAYKTKGNKVIVPVRKGEKVKRTAPVDGHASLKVTHTSETGRRTDQKIMISYNDLESYVKRVASNAPKLKKGEYYTIEYEGNSRRTFNDIQLLVDEFLKYEIVETAIDTNDPKYRDQIYKNFAITKITNLEGWRDARRNRLDERRNENRRLYNEIYNQRRRERMNTMDEMERARLLDYRIRNRENLREKEKNRRADMKKNDPAAYQEYLAKARARKARNKK